MADPRITVLENQHDELAGRVACLEEELRLLRRALTRPEVLERLGIMKVTLEPISPAHTASKERGRQTVARLDALSAARRDALLERLSAAEQYATRTGKSIAEAWDESAGKARLRPSRRPYSLRELVSKVTTRNRHSEPD